MIPFLLFRIVRVIEKELGDNGVPLEFATIRMVPIQTQISATSPEAALSLALERFPTFSGHLAVQSKADYDRAQFSLRAAHARANRRGPAQGGKHSPGNSQSLHRVE